MSGVKSRALPRRTHRLAANAGEDNQGAPPQPATDLYPSSTQPESRQNLETKQYSGLRRGRIVTMRIPTLFTALAAIALTANALPVSTPFPFFTFKGLPECAKTCNNLHNAAIYCLPPTAPVSNEATYVGCFCRSQWLHGRKDNTGICSQECNVEDEKAIQDTYNDLCGIPGPSATRFLSVPAPTSSPSSTAAPSTSSLVALTTSTLTPVPTSTFAPPTMEPQGRPTENETWHVYTVVPTNVHTLTPFRAHKHLVVIVMLIVGLILALAAWLLFVRCYPTINRWYHARKPRTRVFKRDSSHEELVLAKHQRYFDRSQRNNSLLIVDNSRRARLWRWLKREQGHLAEGQETYELQDMNETLQARFGVRYNLKDNKFVVDRGSRIPRIKNRRPRFTPDEWIHANESLSNYYPSRIARTDQTPTRPSTARTEASSIGERSPYSLLDTQWRDIVPQLPVRPSIPQTPRTPQSPQCLANPSRTLSQ